MKFLSLLTLLALCAAASVATANVYDYDMDAPSTFSSQEEVIIGEGEMPAPIAENYGPVPSWGGGCCERVPSPNDHVWDNYCYEKHSGHCGSGCCGRAFCGCGPFQKGCCGGKGCCKSSCGHRFHLPRLNLLGRCCGKSKCCTQKVCQATKCCKQSCCKRFSLPKFRLFSRCCNSKCGKGGKGCCKGQSVGSPVIESQIDEMPLPVIEDDMPPSPPMIDQAT